MKDLKEGEYLIPDDYIIIRNKNVLTVRKSRSNIVTENRCRNCKHFTRGYASQSAWDTTICEVKPKHNKDGEGLKGFFYHANPLGKPCEAFLLKETQS